MTARVDLNADLGEGAGRDEALLEIVTSANVACGVHAGGPAEMRRVVRGSLAKGVAVGAHPGLADPEGFGRREIPVDPERARALVLDQVRALCAIASEEGTSLRHVKPHGALYHMAARDPAIARGIARAAREVDPRLILFGPPGSEILLAASAAGLRSAKEAFAERGYRSDGTLVPRGSRGALVEDPEEAAARAVRLVLEGKVSSVDGIDLEIRPDTICVHGDSPGAVEIARAVRAALERAGIDLRPPGTP